MSPFPSWIPVTSLIYITIVLTWAFFPTRCVRRLPRWPLLSVPDVTHLNGALAPFLLSTDLNVSHTLANCPCRLRARDLAVTSCVFKSDSTLAGLRTATPLVSSSSPELLILLYCSLVCRPAYSFFLFLLGPVQTPFVLRSLPSSFCPHLLLDSCHCSSCVVPSSVAASSPVLVKLRKCVRWPSCSASQYLAGTHIGLDSARTSEWPVPTWARFSWGAASAHMLPKKACTWFQKRLLSSGSYPSDRRYQGLWVDPLTGWLRVFPFHTDLHHASLTSCLSIFRERFLVRMFINLTLLCLYTWVSISQIMTFFSLDL